MRFKSNSIVLAGLSVWMFFYIYEPNLIFLPYSGIIAAILLLLFVSLSAPKVFFTALKRPELFLFTLLIGFAIAYAVIQDVFAVHEVSRPLQRKYPVMLIRLYVEGFLVSLCFWHLLTKASRDPFDTLLRVFAVIVVIQFLFVITMVLLPQWRDMYFATLSAPVDKLYVGSPWYERRGYGVAWNYLFSYPMFNGLVFYIFMLASFSKAPAYAVIALLALGPVLLNARVGLIYVFILLASFAILALSKMGREVTGLKLLSVTVILFMFILVSNAVVVAGFLPDRVIEWVGSGLMQYAEILRGGESYTLIRLRERHLHVPYGLSVLFGEGHYLFRGSHPDGISSDIGYVNYLFFGGFFFSLMVYSAFFVLFAAAIWHSESSFVRVMLFGVLAGLLVGHVKGDIFTANPVIKGSFLLSLVLLMRDRKGNPPEN